MRPRYAPPREPGLPPADLLSEIATALNAAEVEGIPVELAHGAVITDWGYVLRLDAVKGQRWQARTRMLAEFPAPAPDGDELGGGQQPHEVVDLIVREVYPNPRHDGRLLLVAERTEGQQRG